MPKGSGAKDLAMAERVWQTGWTYIRQVVDTAREPFLILDSKLTVLAANETFYRIFDVTERETQGQFVYALGNGQWANKHLRKLLDDILPKETFFRDYEVDHDFPIVGRKVMILNARQVYDADDLMPRLIILAMEDVTKQRNIELKLAGYAKELENMVSERTKELSRRIEQLELVNRLTVGREIKMNEMKEEIRDLRRILKKR